MSASARQLLPMATLVELLPAIFEPWGSSDWYPSRPPNDTSVQRIAVELTVRLPALFIEIARACPAYGGVFGSIGDDFDSPNHMLNYNRIFWEDGLDPRYVLLNHGHDGRCDAWDTKAEPDSDGEYPIVCFNFNCERKVLTDLRISASKFAEYIDALVRNNAPRCGIKSLRRRAKRILAAHDTSRIA